MNRYVAAGIVLILMPIILHSWIGLARFMSTRHPDVREYAIYFAFTRVQDKKKLMLCMTRRATSGGWFQASADLFLRMDLMPICS